MRLTDYLEKNGITQADFAQQLGVTPAFVSQWINGTRRVPSHLCPTIERLTHRAVLCEDLRPDIDWGYLRGTAKRRRNNGANLATT